MAVRSDLALRPAWATDLRERTFINIVDPHIHANLPQHRPTGLFIGRMYGYELVADSRHPLSTHTTIDLVARLSDDNQLWIFQWAVRGTVVDSDLAQHDNDKGKSLPSFQPHAKVSGTWLPVETYKQFEELRIRDGKHWYAPEPKYGRVPSGHRFFHGPQRNSANGRDLEPRWLWRVNEVEIYRALVQCRGMFDRVPELDQHEALRWMDTLD
ncbi:hypothetical protein E8E13_001165 [Curvularia kusanoi]|uniref:Uncharacterized protein n=1 Tax=Curvularia kusanoi TaxID=90978 RepID=A0A9P4W6J4_CURKU|nr:hypothetical protein E8E13_001165 [Curvularia kusanoi]